MTYLRHGSRNSWTELLANWSVTYVFRRKILLETRPKTQSEIRRIQKGSSRSENDESENEEEQLIDEYIKKWDVLELPNGTS